MDKRGQLNPSPGGNPPSNRGNGEVQEAPKYKPPLVLMSALIVIVFILVVVLIVKFVSFEDGKLSIGESKELSLESAYIDGENVNVVVKKGATEKSITGIRFIFYYNETANVTIERDANLANGEQKTFTFSSAEVPGITNYRGVFIAPIYASTSSFGEATTVGKIEDTGEISSTPPACECNWGGSQCGFGGCNSTSIYQIYSCNVPGCDSAEGQTRCIVSNQCTTTASGQCQLTSATWSTLSTTEGTSISLNVQGSNCDGQTLNFVVWEDDASSGADPVSQNPTSVTFSGGSATGSWPAEWQSDEGDPEYYFIASTSTASIKSTNQLSVSQQAIPATTYYPPSESQGGWRSLVTKDATPTAQQKQTILDTTGLNWDQLKAAKDYSDTLSTSTGIVVIKNGWIAGEWGNTQNAIDVASVTKSLTGLALGKTFDLSASGQLTRTLDPESYAYQYLPSSFDTSDPLKSNIKIKHLMTMSSGMDPYDGTAFSLTLSQALTVPMVASPGTEWVYASLPVNLLSIVVQNATGQASGSFFNNQIGSQIGVQTLSWGTWQGYTTGAAYSSISARDLARICYMTLHNGKWNSGSGETQILKSSTVDMLTNWASFLNSATSFDVVSPSFANDPNSNQYYGNLFWTNKGNNALGAETPVDAYYMHGFRDNLCVVVPSLDMVVVRLSSGGPGIDYSFKSSFMSLIMSAVSSSQGDTTNPTISITSPANGATFASTLSATASASDNIGVSSVSFLLDGNVIGSDSTSPFSLSISTDTFSEGSHTLSAIAYDAAGNSGTSQNVNIIIDKTSGGPSIDPTLLAYWRFDEASGTTAFDIAGTANDGVLINGPTRTTGVSGSALSFDGVDDYVNVTSTSTLNDLPSFTCSAWVYPKSSVGEQAFIYKDTSTGQGKEYCGIDSAGTLALYSRIDYSTTDAWARSADNILTLNTWNFITTTWSAGEVPKLYLNGALVANSGKNTTPSGSAISESTRAVVIGGRPSGQAFNGYIDDARLYNRSLSASEIQQLYASYSP